MTPLGMGLFAGRQRRRQRDRASGVLRDYLDAPAPDRNTPAAELALLAVDFETTGLDAATDVLLSIGFVAVDGVGQATGDASVYAEQGAQPFSGVSVTTAGVTLLQGAIPAATGEVAVNRLAADPELGRSKDDLMRIEAADILASPLFASSALVAAAELAAAAEAAAAEAAVADRLS